jgi:hypothetical protein
MISRMDERIAIKGRLDAAKELCEAINKRPEIIAARARRSAAQDALNRASADFNEVWNEHYVDTSDLAQALAEQHEGLVVLGEDDTSWIACCNLTGLPLFDGDQVLVTGGEEEYEKVRILAGAVTFNPDLSIHIQPTTIAAVDRSDSDAEMADGVA